MAAMNIIGNQLPVSEIARRLIVGVTGNEVVMGLFQQPCDVVLDPDLFFCSVPLGVLGDASYHD